MTRDDRMRRYQEAGAEFIEAARLKAEEILRDVSGTGEAAGRQAGASVDDAVAGGRRGADALVDAVRREIASQLSSLGLATKEDLQDLERRLTGTSPSRSAGGRKAATTTKTRAAKRSAAGKKSAATTKTARAKATAKRAPATAKRAPATAKRAPAAKATGARGPRTR